MKTNITTSNVADPGAVDHTEKSLIDLLADCPVVPAPGEAEDGNRIFVSDEMFQLIKETIPVHRGGEWSSKLHPTLKPLGAVDVFLDSEKHRFDVSRVHTIEIGPRPIIEGSYSPFLNPLQWRFRPQSSDAVQDSVETAEAIHVSLQQGSEHSPNMGSKRD